MLFLRQSRREIYLNSLNDLGGVSGEHGVGPSEPHQVVLLALELCEMNLEWVPNVTISILEPRYINSFSPLENPHRMHSYSTRIRSWQSSH